MLLFIYCLPLDFLIIFCAIVLVAWPFFNSKFIQSSSLTNMFVFLVSTVIVLYTTLFIRTTGHFDIELRPFYTFVMAQDQVEYYRTFFMNALLFVPLGLSMPYVLSKKPRKWTVFVTIGFACLLSVSIEFLQYSYHLGRCETDDVIANTLGATVGTLSYLLYIRILKNREESLMNSKISDIQKLLIDLCAKSLFNKDCDLPSDFDAQELLDEAKRQTVLPQVFSFIKDKCDKDADRHFSQIVAKNIRVEFGHTEVHKVLTENNIPYVVLKGVASALYYKEPMLRMMGDIDVLVAADDIVKADAALKSIGFITTESIDSEGHIAYRRRDGLVCELHRQINGIPNNTSGDKIREFFGDIFTQSIEHKTSNGVCVIPSKFHHGLILLIHTATHLTREGVGLRHLCDWAVFVNSFSSNEFSRFFEGPLKESGLWRFAQLLTLCCVKYLGCDEKTWTGEIDDLLIANITADIFNGGNFGMKDTDRYSQIKYISDRKSGETAKKSTILQLFYSINEKTKKEFKFTNKSRLLLPIGWMCTIFRYLYMVITGQRRLDNRMVISGAKQRKDLYAQLKLFKK